MRKATKTLYKKKGLSKEGSGDIFNRFEKYFRCLGKASTTAKANSSIIEHIANERGGLTKFFSKPEQGGRLYFLNLFFFRAFIAWEKGIPIDPTKEQAQRSNLEEYRAKLKIEDVVLPDPFTINGWLDESAMCRWPKLYFTDISEYLRLKTPQELYYRLCNEYKQGKAYR